MEYDVILVGGGLAGAALARSLALNNVRTLVLERETVFKDRVRGEQMLCWGVAEARALGIYDILKNTCGYEVNYFSIAIAGTPPSPPRDLPATTPSQAPALDFYHPDMQTVLLGAAEEAGATVRRGATVLEVRPGRPARVRVAENGGDRDYQARMVVGADGRASNCRRWGGFEVRRDPERMVISGVLLEGLAAPEEAVSLFVQPGRGEIAITIPLGGQRFRCYTGYYKQNGQRRDPRVIGDFIAACAAAGAPAEWFENARVAGPLASFEGADRWAEHPYRNGIALVGDAAASSDPSFGCGLSLTARDVRVLRDQLLTQDDWEAAGHAYAGEHDRYYGALHRQIDWMVQLLYEPGPQADARRERVLPRMAQEPDIAPDLIGIGPDCPSDEAARMRLFGEG